MALLVLVVLALAAFALVTFWWSTVRSSNGMVNTIALVGVLLVLFVRYYRRHHTSNAGLAYQPIHQLGDPSDSVRRIEPEPRVARRLLPPAGGTIGSTDPIS